MKPRTGRVEQSTKHQLKLLVQELKRPNESVAELYIRALEMLKLLESFSGPFCDAVDSYDRSPD